MPPAPELSVVIPVYGSATILPALAERLEGALAPALGMGNFEVVLVHDNGPDNAWEVIRSLSATRPWLSRPVSIRPNTFV